MFAFRMLECMPFICNSEFINKLKSDGGVESGLHVLANCCSGNDEAILIIVLDYLFNLEKLGLRPDVAVRAVVLLISMANAHIAFAVLLWWRRL